MKEAKKANRKKNKYQLDIKFSMILLKKILQNFGIVLLFSVILFISVVAYWSIRPNDYRLNPAMDFDNYSVIDDGMHNSNTDMEFWNGHFYLIHAGGPFHMGSTDTKLKLERSLDAISWETVYEFQSPGEDIRDPKLAIIGSRMFVYVLKNAGFLAKPYITSYSYTEDGITWQPLQNIQNQEGWLFWKPKTNDGLVWYVSSYWYEHGVTKLMNSTDGITWTDVSIIYTGNAADETAIEFLSDGRIISTIRVEWLYDSAIGSNMGGTMICVSEFPYITWSYTYSKTSRLDGPCLFSYNDNIYAIGRFQPEIDGFMIQLGSLFSTKKTALYALNESSLTYISDFPSSGDTSYAGVVIRGDNLYACYYTNDISRNFAWVLGMVNPTSIHMMNITLSSLEAARASPIPPYYYLPLGNYLVTAITITIEILVLVIYKRNKKKRIPSLETGI